MSEIVSNCPDHVWHNRTCGRCIKDLERSDTTPLTAVDTEIIEVLKAYKRYPYGTKEEPHITGDVAQTRLKALIGTIAEQIKADTEKAYGGCHNCYGKGYATVKSQIIGYGTDGDIGGYEGKYKHDTPTQMKFCDCDRGQRLKDYMENNNE